MSRVLICPTYGPCRAFVMSIWVRSCGDSRARVAGTGTPCGRRAKLRYDSRSAEQKQYGRLKGCIAAWALAWVLGCGTKGRQNALCRGGRVRTDPPGDRGSVAPWLMNAPGSAAASAPWRTIAPATTSRTEGSHWCVVLLLPVIHCLGLPLLRFPVQAETGEWGQVLGERSGGVVWCARGVKPRRSG